MPNVVKKSILGGVAIGLGCCAYVSIDNKYLGAFLFSIGLLTICSRQWGLLTGKFCGDNKPLEWFITWIMNFIGIAMTALIYRFSVADWSKVTDIATNKLNKNICAIICSAILCEFCIYVAVIGYRKIESEIGKNLSIILGVMVFILCGFEHCIADMFYVMFVPFSLNSIGFICLVTVANCAGALLLKYLDGDAM